ncbi:PRC-barrel domain containing protein [Haloterrigena salifodinae]|uniref:PRC-barrel domain containing protein n=1 Tax=Haloterrigena salifodinae TaxID=2675099 RepID=A0A8T8E601_9EURY|nr:PRC-barrel domain containing protein [Haloterrigena salifodinae]QRV16886.1 PRC-barrel domain containing protein [Haloterrigena salifodinae]
MSEEITADEGGKRILDSNGTEIGVVVDVDADKGTASVEPEQAKLGGDLESRLGWGRDTQSQYPLRHDAIDDITDEAIRLREEY